MSPNGERCGGTLESQFPLGRTQEKHHGFGEKQRKRHSNREKEREEQEIDVESFPTFTTLYRSLSPMFWLRWQSFQEGAEEASFFLFLKKPAFLRKILFFSEKSHHF